MSMLSYDFCFFFKQKTAYEMRISDWSSDVCSSDLTRPPAAAPHPPGPRRPEAGAGTEENSLTASWQTSRGDTLGQAVPEGISQESGMQRHFRGMPPDP